MGPKELTSANALCVTQAITITLYTGTNSVDFSAHLLAKYQFDTEEMFRDTYVTQKLGSRNQKFNANYGPGIYLTNNLDEAKGYGPHTIQFDCTGTPFANLAGKAGTLFRKTANIVGGGPQLVLAEPKLAALLLVVAGTTSYYALRTPKGVETSRVGI